MVTILNSSVITAFGDYSYTSLTIEEVKAVLRQEGFQSAIGHPETARLLSILTGMSIPVNRIEYRQQPGEKAIVFKVFRRLKVAEVVTEIQVPPEEWECGLLIRHY